MGTSDPVLAQITLSIFGGTRAFLHKSSWNQHWNEQAPQLFLLHEDEIHDLVTSLLYLTCTHFSSKNGPYASKGRGVQRRTTEILNFETGNKL